MYILKYILGFYFQINIQQLFIITRSLIKICQCIYIFMELRQVRVVSSVCMYQVVFDRELWLKVLIVFLNNSLHSF